MTNRPFHEPVWPDRNKQVLCVFECKWCARACVRVCLCERVCLCDRVLCVCAVRVHA